MQSLQGKAAIVTGASSGIGAAIARELAAAGANLLLTARREGRLRSIAEELGSNVVVLPADMARPEVPQRLLDLAVENFGAADILINNAGIFRVGGVSTFDLDDLAPMIALNYEAVVRTSYIFADAMKRRGSGSIVNISSIGANVISPQVAVYGGLKKALEIFTEALRIDLAGTGVRVGIIAPGTTDTEIFDHFPDGSTPAKELTPLQPEDVARAVRFLLEQPAHANIPHLRIYASEQES